MATDVLFSQFWPKSESAALGVWVDESTGEIKEFNFEYPKGHNFFGAAESVRALLHETRSTAEALEGVGYNENSQTLVLRRRAA